MLAMKRHVDRVASGVFVRVKELVLMMVQSPCVDQREHAVNTRHYSCTHT